jgi:uncharacterized protein
MSFLNSNHLPRLLLVMLACVAPVAAQTLPQPVGRINDFASVLDETTEQELASLVETVERETTAQIAVATVTSLEGQSVEEYALKLFNAWGVGQKGKDNGVLVLVAPTEREMRIEVGYGLEGVLPDGLAGRVIREDFTPPFRDGDYRSGILAGTRRIADIVRRNEVLTPDQIQALAQQSGPPVIELPGWAMLPFTGLFVATGAHLLGLGVGAKVVGYLFGGLLFLVMGSVVSYLTAGTAALALVPVAALVAWWGLRRTRNPAFANTLRGSQRKKGRWVSGPGGARSSSGGGRSSSGGSFGGGRSGGGGASGKW